MYVSLQKEVNFTAKERSLVSILYRHAGPVNECRYVAAAWGKLQLSGFRKWDNTTRLSFLTNATNATPILLDLMIWGSTCWHMHSEEKPNQWIQGFSKWDITTGLQPMQFQFRWSKCFEEPPADIQRREGQLMNKSLVAGSAPWTELSNHEPTSTIHN